MIMEIAMQKEKNPKAPRRPLQHRLGGNAGVASIAVFFVCCAVAFSFATDTFLTAGNLLNVLRQSAPLLIVATAMTLVITTGGIDLSIGSTLALVGALAAIALHAGASDSVVLIGGLLLGALIGAINGYFIAWAGMPAFIVTLGTLSVIRGLALLITQGYSVPIENDGWFVQLGRGHLLGVPMPAVISIVILFAGWFALRHMRFGRYVVGIGTNAEGVRRAGVNVRLVTLKVYILSGADLLASLPPRASAAARQIRVSASNSR
jgi:simple sugar transport system permease protein